MIHVDTSFLVDLLREQASRKAGPAGAWLSAHEDEALGASVFVTCELEAGAARAAHPQRERSHVRALMATVAIVYPDAPLGTGGHGRRQALRVSVMLALPVAA